MRRFIIILLFSLLGPLVYGQPDSVDFGAKFRDYGLVNLQDLDPSIKVSLPYATADNFTGKNLYGTLSEAYFIEDVANRLVAVQADLSERRPGYTLLILDAARPRSVQQYMFDLVKDTPLDIYVANPTRGGMHNFGVAVDLTIVDIAGRKLDMGTGFDHFGPESHVGKEAEMVSAGRISAEARVNRRLLIDLMSRHGFKVYSKEWWHFDSYTTDHVRQTYKLLDF